MLPFLRSAPHTSCRRSIQRARTAALLGLLMLPALLGLDCSGISILLPDGTRVAFDIVEVELVNLTDYDVEPFLYVDPEEDILLPGTLINEDNRIILDPPLAPDEVVSYEIDCDDIGTVASDYALLLINNSEAIESDNGPWLTEDEHFACGDRITFVYAIDPGTGVFFTRVEVNGQFLMD